jgi:hypothetical protein
MEEISKPTRASTLSDTSKNEFSMAVEKKAIDQGINIITALAMVAAECGIEIKQVPKMINRSLKDKLEAEALSNRTIRGQKGTDIFDKFG